MLPLVLDLSGRTALVVGGGPVGVRKATAVLDAGGRVRLVDPNPAAGVDHPLVTRVVEMYLPHHLDEVVLAFACATPEVNAAVLADATARGVWACDASDSARGDFTLPAVVRRGDLTIAVSTGGAAPALARRITERLREQFDDAYADWVRILGEVRAVVLASVPDAAERRRLFEGFADPVWLDRVRAVGPNAAKTEMLAAVRSDI